MRYTNPLEYAILKAEKAAKSGDFVPETKRQVNLKWR
jgi:hypothetical protein